MHAHHFHRHRLVVLELIAFPIVVVIIVAILIITPVLNKAVIPLSTAFTLPTSYHIISHRIILILIFVIIMTMSTLSLTTLYHFLTKMNYYATQYGETALH
jgi:hypothetical protein